jgi:hypothetical protein
MLPYGVEGERDASLDVSRELEKERISTGTRNRCGNLQML